MGTAWRAGAGLLVLLLLTVCGGGGEGSPAPGARTWIVLDASAPAGTPASCRLDEALCDDEQSVFDVRIPGFWMEEKHGDDGRTYQRVTVPGLGSHDALGAPDLPLLRLRLAVPTVAQIVQLDEVVLEDVLVVPDVLVWPQPVPEGDHVGGHPEEFRIDEQIYSSSGDWPPSNGPASVPVVPFLRSIPGALCEAWLCRWDPSTRDLKIPARARYRYLHAGALRDPGNRAMSRERARAAGHLLSNWTFVGSRFPVEPYVYLADFLIVHPEGYEDELEPFVEQKKSRGFDVTVMPIPSPGTCATIRDAIGSWLGAVPVHHDAYCLLVGDQDLIPLCVLDTTWNVHATDDLYASPDGDDLDEEVYLGRLSVDGEEDCAAQIAKILAYEDSPHETCCYDQVALWAHKEEAPGKFVAAQESVRLGTYAVPPVFTTYYGHRAGVTNEDVLAHVNAGLGLVCYRGHGNSFSTAAAWNLTDEFFDADFIGRIACPAARAPVVWSLACSNNDLGMEDSAGEAWMELPGTGAVGYYAATGITAPTQNDEIGHRLFEAVYDLGLVTHAQAIEYAEAPAPAPAGVDSYWRYMLLGDPDMKVRRRNPVTFLAEYPSVLVRKPPPELLSLPVRVELPGGTPLVGALVALYKPGATGGESVPSALLPDDVHVNGYTDEKGEVTLLLAPQTTGPMWISVEDDEGNVHRSHDILIVDAVQK